MPGEKRRHKGRSSTLPSMRPMISNVKEEIPLTAVDARHEMFYEGELQ